MHFCLSQLKVLGKIVNGQGIAPDPEMLRDMENFPTPRNGKQVLSFLGLCGVFMNFIPDYMRIAEPLYKITHKTSIWKWEAEQQQAFENMKAAMLGPTILHHPDFSKDFYIFSDASLIGAGAVLMQKHGETLFPVSYASWIFIPAERNYSTTEREMLALVKAVRKWKGYFLFKKLEIHTDHKSLTGIMNLKDPHGRIARWTHELGEFHFNLKHIKGTDNIVPDALSRAEAVSSIIASVLSDLGNIEEYEAVCGIDILSLPSDEEWHQEQSQDAFCFKFVQFILNKKLPLDNKWALEILREEHNYVILEDNVLYKVTHGHNGDILRKVVPASWRKMLTMKYHDSMYRGTHAGRDKTLANLSEAFYFPKMAEYVALYVKTCHICQKIKEPKSKPWTPLGEIEASFPLDLLSMDLWKPGVKSRGGNKYVLTIIDGFTKFVQIAPVPNKRAETVARALTNFITTFGVPNRIHSDLGKEFVNEVLKCLFKTFGSSQSNTTAYHPQGNAYAERIHKFFRQAVASYYQDDHRIWDEFLPFLIMCYNDSFHSALGCTPAEAFLGRRMNISPYLKQQLKKNTLHLALLPDLSIFIKNSCSCV
jgi:hypothetical protein